MGAPSCIGVSNFDHHSFFTNEKKWWFTAVSLWNMTHWTNPKSSDDVSHHSSQPSYMMIYHGIFIYIHIYIYIYINMIIYVITSCCFNDSHSFLQSMDWFKGTFVQDSPIFFKGNISLGFPVTIFPQSKPWIFITMVFGDHMLWIYIYIPYGSRGTFVASV